MKIPKLILFVLILCSVSLYCQEISLAVKPLSQYPKEQLKTDEYGQVYYYDQQQKARIYDMNGETVVVMDNLFLVKRPTFNNQLDRNYYYFLNTKLNRVYPLFLKALDQYRGICQESKMMDSSSKRTYVRARQNELADQYEAQLKDLTTTEGRVFTKLMNRATGKTVYEIIKEMRGGWSAFWWNVKGNMADISLKQPYDPYKDRTDAYIESLLQSNWNIGYLQPYDGYKDFKVIK